jgi:CheY-like chemotaxis protein
VRLRLPTLESLPVLVVDDSADNIKLLQRYLGGTRYQLSSLREPEKALQLIEQSKPQIVILDLMMPGVDGFEILSRLHSNPVTCQIPVVVCTILPQEELALSLGASAFMHKPVMQEKLLAVLDRLASEKAPGAG